MKRLIAGILTLCLLMFPLPVLAAGLTQYTDLPTLYIQLDNGAAVGDISKDNKLPGTFAMRAAGYEDLTDLPITIKGRGNSTWNLPKKPYQIKFESKTDLLGMGKAKKWILLANYWDKTLMRNAITYDFANRIHRGFSTECRFVDLFINGKYRGNYLLTEKVEFDKQRINEDAEKGALLFELESTLRHTNCTYCLQTPAGVHATLKEPEEDEEYSATVIAGKIAGARTRFTEIEAALTKGFDTYSRYIDVDSFVDWYIENELAKNFDAAFFTSCYCYLDAEGVLHMGPVWDVDVCYGNQDVNYIYDPSSVDNGLNPYNYRADKGAWYTTLFDDPDFAAAVKNRWKTLKEDGSLAYLQNRIDYYAAYLAKSQEKETDRWPDAMMVSSVRDQGKGQGGPVYYSFEDEVDYLKSWLARRIDWLDSQWNDSYGSVSGLVPTAVIPGSEAGLGAKRSTLDGDIWSWKYQYSDVLNSPFFTTAPLLYDGQIRSGGQYVITVEFNHNVSKSTDYLMLRLKGISRFGDEMTLLSTPATHVTYATAAKDETGYATLRLAFDTANYNCVSYFAEIDAYNANASIRKIALYKIGGQTVVYGDVDGDGAVNAADALLILKAAVNKVTLNAEQRAAAELNGDGAVNAADALLVLKFAVHKIDRFPIEQK